MIIPFLTFLTFSIKAIAGSRLWLGFLLPGVAYESLFDFDVELFSGFEDGVNSRVVLIRE
jgi:hypothetical protein